MTKVKNAIVRPLTVDGISHNKEFDYGFMTRTDFINLTGIFVSPSYFRMIVDDYEEQQELSPECFALQWKSDNEYLFQTIELKGNITCPIDDEDITAIGTDHDIVEDRNVYDVINDLLIREYSGREKIDEFRATLEEIKGSVDTNKIMKAIKNLQLQLDILHGLVHEFLNDKECADVIENNTFLYDICKISVNQIGMLTDDLKYLDE